MVKVSITKKLVENNSQLADLLAEKNIKVGDKIRVSKQSIEGKVENTESENQNSDINDQSQNDNGLNSSIESSGPKYIVKKIFQDKFDNEIVYKIGQEVPLDFDEERIHNLLNRDLIQEA